MGILTRRARSRPTVLVLAVGLIAGLILAVGAVAWATYTPGPQDLTYAGASEDLNDGAVIEQAFAGVVGTGSLKSFLRVQEDDVEAGYNTSDRRNGQNKILFGPDSSPVPTDDKTDPNFTIDLPLNEVPIVLVGDTLFRQSVGLSPCAASW